MKKLAALIAFIAATISVGAFADTFETDGPLIEKLRNESQCSGMFRANPKHAADIYAQRVKWMMQKRDDIRKGTHEKTIAQTLNLYVQVCKRHVHDFDVVQLHRSKTWSQLDYNLESMINAYRVLLDEVSPGRAVSLSDTPTEETTVKKGKAKKTSTETPELTTARTKTTYSGSRPSRQNKTQNGRSYHK